jgi:uncharacterized protein (DUF697 family)
MRRIEMHDIDRTQLEFGQEFEAYEGEYPMGQEYESYPEPYGEAFSYGEAPDGPFGELEEMDLASRLLDTSNEAELEQFLGDLFKRATRAVGGFIKSPVGRMLGQSLKNVAKQALPMVGGALGSMVAPGVGTAVGSSLGSMAGRLFGLELEGLSGEDQEYEVARRFVRFAGDAARQAALAPPNASPQQVVQAALAQAARMHAPGLLTGAAGQVPGMAGRPRGRSGRWIRRGGNIILMGA